MIVDRLKRGLKQLGLVFLLIVGIVGGIGLLVYALYKVASFNESLYAIIFYLVLCTLGIFYLYKGLRKKLLTTIFLKIVRVLIKIIAVICIISAIMLWGAFVVRYPIFGGLSTPFLAVFLLIAGVRFRLFSFFKKL